MIHIKHPSIEQLPALAQLFDAYRVFYKKTSDVEGAITFLHERIEQKESVVFVAEMDGELVGFTQLYPFFLRRIWLVCGSSMTCLFTQKSARKVLESF